ncbi:hypothetical protein ACFSUS_19420 [Spirosoma soli]|uniref:Lipoprotein n=1 Tax=Spirosoma soli TaxID=1770529 RepID=A0ABW5M775_9BACT
MKKLFNVFLFLIAILATTGCHENDLIRSAYQQAYVYDFSEDRIFTFDATKDRFVSSYRIEVSGTISDEVVLTIRRLDKNNQWVVVGSPEPINLQAGTYINKVYSNDYYGSDRLELVVTSPKKATGNLSIKWGVN